MTELCSGTLIFSTALATIVVAIVVKVVMTLFKRHTPNPSPSRLRFYGLVPLAPVPDSSPACIKLLTYLKMTNTEFDYVPFSKHGCKRSPRGKVPWAHGAVLGDRPVSDSSVIMDVLVLSDPTKYDLDSHLSKEENAVGISIKIMLEESSYFHVFFVHWSTDECHRCTILLYLQSVPPLLRGIISRQVQKKLLRDLKGQGTGLLDDNEVTIKAEKEIRALSDYLGSKRYLFGDQISSYDATVYAYAAGMIQGDWNHPIVEIARGCSNLVDYVKRMRKEFWHELQIPQSSEKDSSLADGNRVIGPLVKAFLP